MDCDHSFEFVDETRTFLKTYPTVQPLIPKHVHKLDVESVWRVENGPALLDSRGYVRNVRKDIDDDRRINDD